MFVQSNVFKTMVGPLMRGKVLNWIKRLEIAEEAAKGLSSGYSMDQLILFDREREKKRKLLVLSCLFQESSTFILAVFHQSSIVI